MSKDKIILNIIDGYKEGDALATTNAFYGGLWNSEERTLTIEVQKDENIENILNTVELKSSDSSSKFLSVTYQTSDAVFDLEEYYATTAGGLQKADTEEKFIESQAEVDNINIDKLLSVSLASKSTEQDNVLENNMPPKEEVLSLDVSDSNISLASSTYSDIEHVKDDFTTIDLSGASFEEGFGNIDTTTDLASFFDFDILSVKIKESA